MERFLHFWAIIYALFYVALAGGVVVAIIVAVGDWFTPNRKIGTALLNSLERWGG